MLVFLLMDHLLACGLLATAIESAKDSQTGDVFFKYGGWLQTTMDTDDKSEMYVAALHWAIQTMTTIRYGDIKLRTDQERIFALFAMAVGGDVLRMVLPELFMSYR